ncbi:hypothetical protein D3C76_988670 [compost metagenome]
MLQQFHGEASARLEVELQTRTGECVADRRLQRLGIADLADGLQCGGEVAAVVVQHRRARAQLRLARRGIGVGAEVVVEAPATDMVAQAQRLRAVGAAADLAEHAVEGRHVLFENPPVASVATAQHRPVAVHQQRRRAMEWAGPDAFALDFRVQAEGAAHRRRRQAEGDGVAEVLSSEAEAQAHHIAARAALDFHFARTHAARMAFRPGPEGRLQPAFPRQRIHHAAVGGFREQAQGAVKVGLAAAVGAGDQVQPTQRQHQRIDRAIVGNGEGMQHPGDPSR